MFAIFLNFLAVLLGSVLGAITKRGIRVQYLHALTTSMGIAVLLIGMDVALTNMAKSEETVLFIFALAIGGLVGTMLKLDTRMEKASKRLEKATKQKEGAPSLAEGITTAILLCCVGTLAIMGPIISAIAGDNTLLMTSATLNFVTMLVIASTYGIGVALTAIPVFLWMTFFYVFGYVSKDFLDMASPNSMSQRIMVETNIVGGALIAAAGLGVLHIKDCKTVNLLPALLIPMIWLLLKAAV